MKKDQYEKREAKLTKKRNKVFDLLASNGVGLASQATARQVIETGYEKIGRKLPEGVRFTLPSMHALLDVISRDLKSRKRGTKNKFTKTTKDKIQRFYRSYEWRRARYTVIVKNDGRCEACGLSKRDGIVLHVDHIKPLRKNWESRLDLNNLQVLCEICNHGKGNWDETDWRES